MLSATQIGMPGGVPMPLEWLLRGSSRSGGDALTLTPRPDPVRQRRDRKKLRIASFITLTGSAGIWGPAATNSTMLAVSEINQRGGILGREVEIVFHDAGGPIEDVVRAASDVVASDDADIIMGTHISAVRIALRKVVGGRIPYVYTSVYEGGERTPGVMAIGETPRAQLRPAIEWLANAKKAARWYLIGSDYVWPWLSHRAVKKYIAGTDGRVVGEEFVRLGEHDHNAHIARIRAAKPDVVLISLLGTDSVVFNRAFAEQGLASKMLRLAGAMDETVLLGIGADNTENLFAQPAISWIWPRAKTRLFAANTRLRSAATRRRLARSGSRIMRASGFSIPSHRARIAGHQAVALHRDERGLSWRKRTRRASDAALPPCRSILPRPTASIFG